MTKNMQFLCALLLFLPFQNKSDFNQVKKDYLQDYALVKSRYGRTIRYAFARIDYLQQSKSGFASYLASSEIKKIFHPDFKKNNVLSRAQSIVTNQLYILYFASLVRQSYALMHGVIHAKQYWQYELIREQSAFYQKLPTYWIHKSAARSAIAQRICFLENLEEKIAHILGIAFCGINTLKNIHHVDHIDDMLQKTLVPLYEKFKHGCKDTKTLEDNFNNLSALYANMQTLQSRVSKALCKNGLPHHVSRHGCFYSALTVVGFAAFVWYQIHKDEIPEYAQRGHKATKKFMSENIVNPLIGLKKTFWNYDDKMEDIVEVPQNFWECKWMGSADVFMYLFKDYLMQLSGKLNCVLKRQQINYYLSSIVPVALIMYFGSRSLSSMYNHESYYNPMRFVMRNIDIVLTRMSGSQELQFADQGRLYFLASQLKLYVGCLNSEELVAMQQDSKELLSLKYNCEQKQKVLERMYRTYEFLK